MTPDPNLIRRCEELCEKAMIDVQGVAVRTHASLTIPDLSALLTALREATDRAERAEAERDEARRAEAEVNTALLNALRAYGVEPQLDDDLVEVFQGWVDDFDTACAENVKRAEARAESALREADKLAEACESLRSATANFGPTAVISWADLAPGIADICRWATHYRNARSIRGDGSGG